VAVCDVNAEGARSVAAEFDAEGFAMDVTDPQSVREATRAAEAAFGPVDLLVNNAGTDQFGFFKDTDEALWQRIVDINLFGVMRATHAVLAGMTERGGGRIVNIASEAGRVGSNGSAAYSAAKGGVIAFTKTIAREGARYGILCNAIAPGPIDTPLLNRAPTELGDLGRKVVDVMVGSTVLRRLGSPDEVASVVAFLCSEDSSYVTGQALGVSGGLAMI
jgi:2-hydroxycyclohexanecarboxyl-CoA dehydrogenase